MNGVSHNRAIQLIDRRIDGILDEDQSAWLDQHLQSCNSCHSYAADMAGLSARLQNEFHRRWDGKSAPSQQVMERLMDEAQRVPGHSRIAAGTKMFAGAAALVLLGFLINFVVSQLRGTSEAGIDTEAPGTPPIETSLPAASTLPETRLLAFSSDQNGNSDIYTVYADGSGMINLTNHPARDSNPVWSPDGKRIAFESERDGFTQVYLMNADGLDVIQLTHSEADHFLPVNIHGETHPWSGDGSKLLFLRKEPGVESSALYALDINSGDLVELASGNVLFGNISWSPDGKYVGYVLNESSTPDATFVPGLYVVDAEGMNHIAINTLLPQTDVVDRPSYYWSRDGNSIVFIAYRHLDEGSDQWIAYEVIVESPQLIERATSSTIMDEWWEGTSLIHGTDPYILTWLRSDGTFSTFKPLDVCDLTLEADYGFLMRRSPNGSQAINIYCPNRDLWFYYASPDGTMIKPLVNFPIPSITVDHSVTSLTWSPDDRYIAVTQVSPEKSSLYVLNVEDPSLSPVEIVLSSGEFYTVPSWRPVP
jgi:Tol biopolymer transport system component